MRTNRTRKTVTRMFALLFAVLCLTLAACQQRESEPAADSAVRPEARQEEEEEAETLQVVTDKYLWADGQSSLLKKGP